MVFGSNPADFFGWGNGDEDLLLAQDTSLAGQFVQQWKLRMRAIAIGDMALFYKTLNKKSFPDGGGRRKSLKWMKAAVRRHSKVRPSKLLGIAYAVV